jgi:hypothetical protein
MKENDEIEDLFRSSFDDFSVEPPPHVKVSIDERIDFKKKNNSWRGFAFLMTVLFIAGGVYLFSASLFEKQAIVSSNEEQMTNHSDSANESVTNETRNKKRSLNTSISEKSTVELKESTTNEISPNTHASISTKVNLKSEKISTSFATVKKSKVARKVKTEKITPSSNLKMEDNPPSKSKYTSQKKTQKKRSNSIQKTATAESFKIVTSEIAIANNPHNTLKNETETALLENNVISAVKENTPGTESPKPVDSLANMLNTVNSIKGTVSDSLQTDTLLKIPTVTHSKWMISSHFGSSKFSNKLASTSIYSLTESKSFYFNMEATRSLKHDFSTTFGFQTNQYVSELSKDVQTIEYFQNGYDSIIIDTSLNTVIHLPHLDSTYTNSRLQQFYNITNLSIPVYFGYTQHIFKGVFLDATAGALLSYQTAKFITSDLNSSSPTVRSFGVKMCVRPQLRYQFNRFGISISSNFGYDFIPTLNWTGISRKRSYVEFGIGLHFQL